MPSIPTRRLSCAVAIAILSGMALGSTALHAQTVPTGFTFEPFIGPPFIGECVGFTFLPDGRVILIERSGNVRLATVGATSSVMILTVPNVSTQIERGLLGVAIDPNWPTRPYVYLSYTRTDSLSTLVLYRAIGDLTAPTSTNLTLTSPYIILETPDLNPYHNAGTIRFGNDGRLYLTWGDDGNPCQAQDLTLLNGKMLRLDVSHVPRPGGGPPAKSFITPPDNPFVGDPNSNARLVYLWGLRNPFRFTFDRVTGALYLGEVGEEAWEEIDRIASGAGGPNFGWPIREGPALAGLGYTCGQSNTFTSPIYSYAHAGMDAAVIGGPSYRSVASSPISFPSSYDGSYFFLDWVQGWIRRIVLVGNVWQLAPAVPGQPSADHWADGLPFYVDFQEGSDGALYLVNQSPGGIFRIKRAQGGATSAPLPSAPVAALDVRVRPNPASAGQGVEFLWSAPRIGRVELCVFDAGGRVVVTLGSAGDASRGVVAWNGRDSRGSAVPAGVYFYRVRGPDGASASGRVTLLR